MEAGSALRGGVAWLVLSFTGEPVWADRVSCYVSRSGGYGEIIAAAPGGARDEAPLAWAPAPERRLEFEHFAPPGLMLEYSRAFPERLVNPVSAQILISRVADPNLGAAPPLEELSVRATFRSGMVLSWEWPDRREAHARLARHVSDTGEHVTVDLLALDRRVLASSSFHIQPDADLFRAMQEAGEEAGRLERSADGGCRLRLKAQP